MSSLYIPPFGGAGGAALGEPGSRLTQGLRGDGGSRTQGIAIGGRVLRGAEDKRPVARQLSRSYFVPRSLEGYERHLRQIQCEGYLQRQSRSAGTWRRRWFLLKDGYLSYFQDQDEAEVYRSETDSQLHHHPSSQRQLSLDCVEAVRTDEKIGALVIRVISSHRDDLVLRAESKESMNEWLFGFHRALASIIARYMENRGEGWQEERDWKSATQGGGSCDGADGSQRDPFRATTPSQVRKVLGHGHGRARRLSLRQWRLANSEMASRSFRIINTSSTGHRSGARSNGYNTPINSSHHRAPPSVCIMPAYGGNPMRGAVEGAGPSVALGSGANNAPVASTKGNASARPPKPSPHRSDSLRRLMDERRRRADSMGGIGIGGGSWVAGPHGTGGMELGLGPLPVTGSFCLGLSRTVSAGHEPGRVRPASSQASGEEFLEGSLDGFAGEEDGSEGNSGFELSDDEYLYETKEHKDQPRSGPAAAVAAAIVYGSSGDENQANRGKSSESGEGSTSDEVGIKGPGSTLTSQEAFGLGLGMDVEAHSFLQEDTYISSTDRGLRPGGGDGGGGGGGGKYIPPAMRAAAAKARAAAEAAGVRDNDGEGQPCQPWPPCLTPPRIDVSCLARHGADEGEDGSCGGDHEDDEDEGVFASLGMDNDLLSEAPHTPQAKKVGGSLQLSAVGGGATVMNGNANASPTFGGAGGGSTFAVLPNGVTLPWSPAHKDHYYTGDYHSRKPCNPDGECNARGGGHGGGPAPREEANILPRCSGSSSGGVGHKAGGGEQNARFPREAQSLSPEWTASEEPGREGLWWSCGAWSIMGRREKQEDRFCVMPDFSKSLTIRVPKDTLPAAAAPSSSKSPASRQCSVTAGPHTDDGSSVATPGGPAAGGDSSETCRDGYSVSVASTSVPIDEEQRERGRLFRLAQGFFGVYDGHCGSEAVQFVRDRLHAMIGEHDSFAEEPSRAIREAFLAADEEFLNFAAERDWFSGTTVLVALMRGRKLVIGNLGDGEAVLCRKEKAVHMSPVHNPGRVDENRRIVEANGWVTTEQELFLRQLKQMDLEDPEIRMAATDHVRWTTITRVCGELAVSRSIGDRDFKGFTKRRLEEKTEGVAPLEMTVFSWPNGHSGEFRDDLLTADPEFQSTEIDPEDEFLLMACDGLWDVLGKDEAVEHARKFFDEGLCAQAVAERMCELAYRMGTSDNVTTVVIQFLHSRPSF